MNQFYEFQSKKNLNYYNSLDSKLLNKQKERSFTLFHLDHRSKWNLNNS